MTCRILVALDGSPSSEAALSEVGRIALGGASVHFLHVIPMLPVHVDATSAGVMARHDQALSYLGGLRESLPEVRGLDLIRAGDPAEAILQVALEFNIDLIALGTHVRPGLAKEFLGSVAETVVQGARVPVLLGRRGILGATGMLRRILVPVDGSEDSLTIIPIVMVVALRAAAEVVFLHVSEHAVSPLPPTRFQGEFGAHEDPRERLLGLADRLEKSDLEFWQTVAHGDAVEEIVSHAESLDADLIAMSTQSRTKSERTVVGRAALAVLECSPRSVLLQKPASHSIVTKGWSFQ